MKVEINPRSNGACPLCSHVANCRIRNTIAKALAQIADSNDAALDLVIYSCPRYEESQ